MSKPTEMSWRGKTITTGIYKSSVAGPIFLDNEDVENDSVIDRKFHGGIDQAVYAYGLGGNSYPGNKTQTALLQIRHKVQ